MKNRTVNTACIVALSLVFASGVFLFVLLCFGKISECFGNGENLGEGLGQACVAIMTIFAAVFGMVLELVAVGIGTPAIVSTKKRASIVICSVAVSVLCSVAIASFIVMLGALTDGGGAKSSITLSTACLVANVIACLYAVVAFIICAVVKGKNAKALKAAETEEKEAEEGE